MFYIKSMEGNILHNRALTFMGDRFNITVVHEDEHWANERIDEAVSEIQRIQRLLSSCEDLSQTSNINENAGSRAVKVDREVYNLISRSLRISVLTQGAFDLTYCSLDKTLWNFDANMKSLPDPVVAARTVKLINYKNLILNHLQSSVYLRRKGMRIGFGAIGMGYAADKAKEVLVSRGVESGFVNASGNLLTWGCQPDGKPWSVAIADPKLAGLPFSKFGLNNMAIATSGDHEKFAIIEGKRYSHKINPTTGMPVSGIKSVSVICPSAELAGAMATPIMVMGVRAGLQLVNQMDKIACIIVDDNNNLHCSQNINISTLL